MSPTQNGESPKLNLPPPIMESGSVSTGSNEKLTENQETDQPAKETSPQSSKAATSNPALPQIDFTALAGNGPTALPAQSITTDDNPLVAQDNDLIEKEWVSKAKKIVEATRGNPYSQSKEMTIFKADYVKKRYNKTLKISE